MHQSSSMMAIERGPSRPLTEFSGVAARPVNAASRFTPSAPPGGHWLMSAVFAAIAWAYSRQLGYPQRVHCVCGKTASSCVIRAVKLAAGKACGFSGSCNQPTRLKAWLAFATAYSPVVDAAVLVTPGAATAGVSTGTGAAAAGTVAGSAAITCLTGTTDLTALSSTAADATGGVVLLTTAVLGVVTA